MRSLCPCSHESSHRAMLFSLGGLPHLTPAEHRLAVSFGEGFSLGEGYAILALNWKEPSHGTLGSEKGIENPDLVFFRTGNSRVLEGERGHAGLDYRVICSRGSRPAHFSGARLGFAWTRCTSHCARFSALLFTAAAAGVHQGVHRSGPVRGSLLSTARGAICAA